MVQRGRRAVYEPEAIAFEKPTPDLEDEYRRKVRMFEHCWAIVLRGPDAARARPRLPRADRLAPPPPLRERPAPPRLLAANAALLGEGAAYRARFAAQLAFLGLAAARPGLPRYYVLVTWATVEALARLSSLRRAGGLGQGGGDAVTRASSPARATARRSRRAARRSSAQQGHEYPFVDGIPVLVVDDEPSRRSRATGRAPSRSSACARREPPPVEGDAVDPYVAELIIGTHGNLYRHLAGGPVALPDPGLPAPAAAAARLLLDIGCNWGRWTIAAARAGYRPIGIDPSFEAIVAARRIARQLGDRRAATSSPTARHLPFADETFDVVFSYGVLQHFSKADVATSRRARSRRVLKPDGYSWVQMPNALGALNVVRLAQRRFREGDRFEVRYWTPARAAARLRPDRPDRADDGRLLHAQPADERPRPAARALPRGRARVRGAASGERTRRYDPRRQRQRPLDARASGARLPARPERARARRASASTGHEYPVVDGVPVLLVEEESPTHAACGRARSSCRRRPRDRRRPVRARGDRRDVRQPLPAPDRERHASTRSRSSGCRRATAARSSRSAATGAAGASRAARRGYVSSAIDPSLEGDPGRAPRRRAARRRRGVRRRRRAPPAVRGRELRRRLLVQRLPALLEARRARRVRRGRRACSRPAASRSCRWRTSRARGASGTSCASGASASRGRSSTSATGARGELRDELAPPDRPDRAVDRRLLHAQPAADRPRAAAAPLPRRRAGVGGAAPRRRPRPAADVRGRQRLRSLAS